MECKDRTPHHCPRYRANIGIYPEWNVKIIIFFAPSVNHVNWNISRMECKALPVQPVHACTTHWNISRMECKVVLKIVIGYLSSYWNISRMECKASISTALSFFGFELEYIQNGM